MVNQQRKELRALQALTAAALNSAVEVALTNAAVFQGTPRPISEKRHRTRQSGNECAAHAGDNVVGRNIGFLREEIKANKMPHDGFKGGAIERAFKAHPAYTAYELPDGQLNDRATFVQHIQAHASENTLKGIIFHVEGERRDNGEEKGGHWMCYRWQDNGWTHVDSYPIQGSAEDGMRHMDGATLAKELLWEYDSRPGNLGLIVVHARGEGIKLKMEGLRTELKEKRRKSGDSYCYLKGEEAVNLSPLLSDTEDPSGGARDEPMGYADYVWPGKVTPHKLMVQIVTHIGYERREKGNTQLRTTKGQTALMLAVERGLRVTKGSINNMKKLIVRLGQEVIDSESRISTGKEIVMRMQGAIDRRRMERLYTKEQDAKDDREHDDRRKHMESFNTTRRLEEVTRSNEQGRTAAAEMEATDKEVISARRAEAEGEEAGSDDCGASDGAPTDDEEPPSQEAGTGGEESGSDSQDETSDTSEEAEHGENRGPQDWHHQLQTSGHRWIGQSIILAATWG